MVSLKNFLAGIGVLAALCFCACAGSRVGQITIPLSQKNLEDSNQSQEEQKQPFVFEEEEPNIYM